ncbi:conserved hypothetical protein [Paecilomyces variotii No. 5]|uniref:Rhodanese domain-containing protein n=1 Tax=Byssochlamys spectabilis (strain No. 5 / NBRC 109023) TaxID=1356009 RepID=V5G1U3_BYSSN|nr:conserved hypothetical protein [Paecilomyces variotii No. 5]
MKLSSCFTVLALAASVLAKGSCDADEEYCGSYLIKARGWTNNDLEAAIVNSNLGARAAADPLNVLFECIGGSRIDAIKYCHNTCRETGPRGGNDYCENHIGGHIYSSIWVPSSSLDVRMPELVRTLQDKEKVVFHCALSQQRGPSAALRYARERERTLGAEASHKQEVYVLEGGFVQWQEEYGKDKRLTEAYVEDIWREY